MTIGIITFKYINNENSNIVIKNLKIKLFIKILMIEKRQLSKTTQVRRVNLIFSACRRFLGGFSFYQISTPLLIRRLIQARPDLSIKKPGS